MLKYQSQRIGSWFVSYHIGPKAVVMKQGSTLPKQWKMD